MLGQAMDQGVTGNQVVATWEPLTSALWLQMIFLGLELEVRGNIRKALEGRDPVL